MRLLGPFRATSARACVVAALFLGLWSCASDDETTAATDAGCSPCVDAEVADAANGGDGDGDDGDAGDGDGGAAPVDAGHDGGNDAGPCWMRH